MFLKKLLEKPKKKNLYILIILSLMATIIIAIAMRPIENTLKNVTGFGVMEFEFAWTADMIKIIFNAWGAEGMTKMTINTYNDFAFIPAYSILSACLLIFVGRRVNGNFQKIGLFMILTPFLAGILDIIENLNLLLMINEPSFITSGSPFIASLCALIKFSILLVDIVFFILALIISLIKKKN